MIPRAKISAARGLALFIGGFLLLNLVGALRSPEFDANLWLLDLRWIPHWLGQAFLLGSALFLLAFGLRATPSLWLRLLTATFSLLLMCIALTNTAQFYVLLARHALTTVIPIPLSLFFSIAFGLIAVVSFGRSPQFRASSAPRAVIRDFVRPLLVCAACILLFPLAQMFCFGKTDYRRPADVIVVFGARAYADGRPSDALADRVRTACRLYQQGYATKLLFSGGPGDGAVHETEAMKRMALRLGIKEEDIFLDKAGLNTQATVNNTSRLLKNMHAGRVLVVSHFYHLPRIKLAYQRAGWDVFTVPARESYVLRQTPFNMAREVVALWVYYLRPLA